MKDNAYQIIIEHQQNWLFGLPESEHLLPMLKLRISEEDAKWLAEMSHLPQTLDQLCGKHEIEPDALREKLDRYCRKGLVIAYESKSGPLYALADAFFWFFRMPGYEGKDDVFNRNISPLLNKYYDDVMAGAVLKMETKGLRAVPVNETIDSPKSIAPYEDVLAIVENGKNICVTTCSCRHRHNLDPSTPDCAHDTQTCLHMGKLGQYMINSGIGRAVSKQEAGDILKRAADAGLIHSVSNTMAGIDTICNCCSCCCAFMATETALHKSIKKGHQPSRYRLSVEADTCKACGTCVKRCPAKALTLVKSDNKEQILKDPEARRTEKKTLRFEADQCLGCGVCAHKCPTGSLKMVLRDEFDPIPETPFMLARQMLEQQGLNMEDVMKRNM